MGIAEDIAGAGGWHAALAALAWQHDLGVSEAMGEVGLDRFEAVTVAPGRVAPPPDPLPPAPLAAPAAGVDGLDAARVMAAAALTLTDLRAAIASYDHCDLRRGAKSLVFADGNPGARVLILGEAPGREEDLAGLPFVGPAGQMLDRMFAAIGLSRDASDAKAALYITNVLPWRPPQNRDPHPDEIAMMMPFVARHIALVQPEVIVALGNTPCAALLDQRGITRLRGQWAAALGLPVLPMFHPAYLLRNPAAKRETWADLLALQGWLRGAR